MKRLCPIVILATTFLISACSESKPPEPKVAGSMSQQSICATAGYLIKQQLGSNFKTVKFNSSCKAKAIVGNQIEVTSGYTSPLGPSFRYTARGEVNGNSLRLEKIKVHGHDRDFIPFLDL